MCVTRCLCFMTMCACLYILRIDHNLWIGHLLTHHVTFYCAIYIIMVINIYVTKFWNNCTTLKSSVTTPEENKTHLEKSMWANIEILLVNLSSKQIHIFSDPVREAFGLMERANSWVICFMCQKVCQKVHTRKCTLGLQETKH